MRTIFGVGDPSAVKRFSAVLFADKARKSYFDRKFARKGRDALVPIQILTELENDAGDTITYDLFTQLRNKPVYGDDRIKGKEEQLNKLTAQVSIDQVRCGVSAGGRMTRKRVLHDLRMIARSLQADWWQRWEDEVTHMYAAGARGINDGDIEDLDYTGFANNPFQAPDAEHLLYGGNATAKNDLSNDDHVSLGLIDRLVAKAKTYGGGTQRTPKVRPINIEGENKYVFLMHSFDEFHLRSASGSQTWMEIQKAAAGAEGRNNPIYKGSMGEYNGVILHEHDGIRRFNDYGVGLNLPASRCLFMGAQFLVKAYGSAGDGLRIGWSEEMDDRGNELVINTYAILGIRKNQFGQKDYGGFTADVYSPAVT